jgi:DNA-directed RNA polymerase I, II, and III subunit RPABC5
MADKYDWYVAELEKLKTQQKVDEKKQLEGLKHFEAIRTGPILDKLGLDRYCCRRHLISQVDMMTTI